MSSISGEVTGVQSDAVSGNVAGSVSYDLAHVPVSGTQVEAEGVGSGDNGGFKEEGLERERDSMAMEVDGEGASSLEANRAFSGDNGSNACGGVEKSDGEKPLNDDGFGGDLKGVSNDELLPEADSEEEGLERERDSMAMEVDFANQSDSRAVLVDSELMVDGEGASSLEGERVSHNVEVNRVFSGDNDFNACGGVEKSGGEKPLNDEGFGGDLKGLSNDELLPYTEKTDNEVVGSEAEVAMSKESDRVSLDECGGKEVEKGKKKGKFRVSDLVWGKVRSHPWWPGQIFEPGDASDKARKYSRPKSYLVAYFGDQTFAWNDKAKLKPFVPHFSQMVKQTSMEAFRHAVACALDEVSRRVEFGLSCACIADDVYSELETQVIENAGIKEQQILHEGVERSFAISSFEPLELLDYITNLALGPCTEVDKLEHVMARGQISAFYRWKGIYHLAEFGTLLGYVNNEADAPITEEKEEIRELIDHEKIDEGILEEHGSKPRKRKNISGDNCGRTKKEKCLSELIPKRGSYKGKGDKRTEGKTDRKPISFSSSSRKESKVSHSGSKTESSGLESQGTTTPMASKESKPSFSVGESILRVAGQLSKPSPLLKLDVLSHGKTTKAKGGSKKAPRQTKVGPAKHSSDEILSLLQLAAREPLKDHTMLTSMVNFFSDFRNSVVLENDFSLKHEESGGRDIIDKPEERPSASESKSAGVTQRCSSPDSKSKEKASESDTTATSQNALSENGQCDEKMEHEEDSPTALTLKFTDLDSIPPEAKLNEIFNQFGPLKDSETQILTKKNCARVVFKRRVDADTAFSSSGKFELFGPSLVCYRLNDAPSPSPRKSSSVEPKRRRKEESPVKRK